ncbi:MAG: DUF1552 domain-containing protein [Planctomycetes bacterium]|nr:DUF1552 domain-containing protein [Planctomycetota bacterium]
MSSKRWLISRRTVLRGLGTTMAIPLLDAMTPSSALAAPAAAAPIRTAFVYVPNGIIMKDWTPSGMGTNFELPSILAPLNPVKDELLVLSGLAHVHARANGDGGGDHARCAGTFLTGVQVRKTSGKDIHAGVSVDQIIADHVGKNTSLPSLEIGCEPGRQNGNCDSGYSCAYSSNISWRTPSMPMAKEIDPRQAFNRLFGDASAQASKREAAKQAMYRRSVLDLVLGDAKSLSGQLGRNDQHKLDEYLESVRAVEKRVQGAESESKDRLPADAQIPEGIPAEFAEHIRLMYDLMLLSFQTDTTRIVTFMHANAGSNRSYREIGVSDGHHSLSHHQGNPEWIEKLRKIDLFHMTEHARFIQKMRDTRDGDRSLLDNSMILYGCGISDGNHHSHDNLPVVLAGKAGGTITTGRHVKYKFETPLSNLFLSMMDRAGGAGERVASFGDSTGRLDQLTA